MKLRDENLIKITELCKLLKIKYEIASGNSLDIFPKDKESAERVKSLLKTIAKDLVVIEDETLQCLKVISKKIR